MEINVEVCSHCKTQTYGSEREFNVYEEFKRYEDLFKKDIEVNINECDCLGLCKGPVVRVNGKNYGEVNSDKVVETILNELL